MGLNRKIARRYRKKYDNLHELDFSEPDWELLGKPICDSQVRWGMYDMEEMVDIIAPEYTLADFYWLRDDLFSESFYQQGEVRKKEAKRNGRNRIRRDASLYRERKPAKYFRHHAGAIEEEVTGIATLPNFNIKEAEDE